MAYMRKEYSGMSQEQFQGRPADVESDDAFEARQAKELAAAQRAQASSMQLQYRSAALEAALRLGNHASAADLLRDASAIALWLDGRGPAAGD